jgi:hypothetical protein
MQRIKGLKLLILNSTRFYFEIAAHSFSPS